VLSEVRNAPDNEDMRTRQVGDFELAVGPYGVLHHNRNTEVKTMQWFLYKYTMTYQSNTTKHLLCLLLY